MQVMAPAKVNLSLRVFRRRSDGFHEIETFIAPISLCDEIKIEQHSGKQRIAFRCDDPSLPKGEDNIVVRAANIFFEQTNITGGVSIVLKKRIPHGAGLGGGSSDAASTLLALNELFETNLPREALAKMAEVIGSDVPFFIFQSAAVCNGRGELVTPTRLREQLSVLLVKPGFAVLSPWAYSQWRNSREIRGVSYRAQQFTRQRFVNDLERPVFEKFVFLAQLKMWLLKQPEVGAALLSGSGSTVFAVLRSHADADLLAQRAKADLEPELWTYACETR
ncbi:MAG: 4-(cytidine 5'-diphospho)-2-C-methyl-D-erythritol kinase [Candidatus Udaeobacter sp.]